MFEMIVNDTFAIKNVFTVYGECNGFEKLKPGTLKDETGKEYAFRIPIGKQLEMDDCKIELQLVGKNIDLNALKGHKLIQ